MLNNIGLPGLLVLVIFLILPIVLAVVAHKRERNWLLWLVVGLLGTGLFGFLLFAMHEETRRLADEKGK